MSATVLRKLLEDAERSNRWLTRGEMAAELRRDSGLRFSSNDMIKWLVEIERAGESSIDRRERSGAMVMEYMLRHAPR